MKKLALAAITSAALASLAFAFAGEPAMAQSQSMYISTVCDGRAAWVAVPHGADHATRDAARKAACPPPPPPRKVTCANRKGVFALVPGDIADGSPEEAGYARARCGG